jgi:hypothetical protein
VTYRQRQQLLRNRGDGRFLDESEAGDLAYPRITRGLAVGDYDNDGRPDVLVSGPDDPLTLFRNEGAPDRHWIGFRLEGVRSNREGIGAQVRVQTGSRTQVRLIRSGSSYCSRSDLRPLFGLGEARTVDRVEVIWPGGFRQEYRALAADRYYLVREDGSCVPDPRVERGKLVNK